jgi:hypothetical protein
VKHVARPVVPLRFACADRQIAVDDQRLGFERMRMDVHRLVRFARDGHDFLEAFAREFGEKFVACHVVDGG